MDKQFQQPIENLFIDTPTPQEDSMNKKQAYNFQKNQNNLKQKHEEQDFHDEIIAQYQEEDLIEFQVPILQNQNYQQLNQDVDVDAKVGEVLERIILNIIPRQETVGLQQQTQLLPVIVQIQALKSQIKHVKPIIDLVCVVDVSSSMEGEKILQVKESLRYIEKILSPLDRISIITFDTHSRINLPWTRNTPDNKEKIETAITDMKTGGTTNIADGVKLGLRMIRYRKQKNPATCMFILTGGNDNNKGADERVAESLDEIDIKDSFVINTFVYGSDYDAKVMKNIANLKEGIFEYIENVSRGSDHFNFAMKRILSIIAKNIKLQVVEYPDYKISKIFRNDLSLKEVLQCKYETEIQYLLDNDNQIFTLLLELPASEKINLQQDIVLKASLQGTLIESNIDFNKQCELKLNFSLQEVIYEPIEIVEVNLLRAKAEDTILEALQLAKQNQHDLAQFQLDKLINEIEKSQFRYVKQLVTILQAVGQVKEDLCEPKLFLEKGEALILDKVKPYFQSQQSLDNSMESFEGKISVCYSSISKDNDEIGCFFYQQKLYFQNLTEIKRNNSYSSESDSPIQKVQSNKKHSIHKIYSDDSL